MQSKDILGLKGPSWSWCSVFACLCLWAEASFSYAGRVGELGEVCLLARVVAVQSVILIWGGKSDRLSREFLVEVACVRL